MKKVDLIYDLVMWIERNLHTELPIEKISEKCGYSKWHLQRMFKEVTGENLGSYVRSRKLTRAAIALRKTKMPIIDITNQYTFDTQQSFTRTFKKQFNQSPGRYRSQADWFTGDCCPPFDKNLEFLPVPQYVRLNKMLLAGLYHSYEGTPDQTGAEYTAKRQAYWEQFALRFGTGYKNFYGLYQSEPHRIHMEKTEISYFTAYEREGNVNFHTPDDKYLINEGNYIMFSYKGKAQDFQSFIFTIYRICLPLLRITRRKGYDVEVYRIPPVCEGVASENIIDCHYHIPII